MTRMAPLLRWRKRGNVSAPSPPTFYYRRGTFCVRRSLPVGGCGTQQPGQLERRTHTYKWHGTVSLLAALDVQTGEVLGHVRRRRRAVEFRTFLDALDAQVPPALDVHIIMDNDGTHTSALIRRWFARRPRFHVHVTPTYASWLNLIERWFAALETAQLRRGVHRSVRALTAAICEFIDAHNADGRPFIWRKSADDILASIKRFAQRTLRVQQG